MLKELQNLVPTEKEMKLQVFINQLTNDLYNNEKIEVDSKRLLDLLNYLTSDDNISTQIKSAIEYQNSRIKDILHGKEVEHLKKYIKCLKENSIPVQKVKELKESVILDNTIVGGRRNSKTLEYGIKLGKIKACEELLEDKQNEKVKNSISFIRDNNINGTTNRNR